MLAKENRLKKKSDFEKVTREGDYTSGGFLVLNFQSNGLGVTRAGFVVSKKVSNKAVVRNKIKRRLREAVRGELNKLKPGFDLVFFVKKGIAEKEFLDIQRLVRELLEKAKLYKSNKSNKSYRSYA